MHGTADPMFPVAHGEALVQEIRDARLLRLDGAGHGVDRADWERNSRAIIEHTSERLRRQWALPSEDAGERRRVLSRLVAWRRSLGAAAPSNSEAQHYVQWPITPLPTLRRSTS
jgi:hypothetical protein